MNVIDPDETEWAAPIVLDPEEGGSLTFCVN